MPHLDTRSPAISPETAAQWSVFVFAPMVFDAPHARKHALVETCARLGFTAVYVEPPNSRSPYHPGRGAPTLNGGAGPLRPPAAPATTADGARVLCVPKKLAVGPVRVGLGRRTEERLQAAWLARFFSSYRARSTTKVLAIVTTARWEPLLRDISFDAMVFDKTDPADTLQGWLDTAEYLKREAALVARSVLVTAAAPSLETEVQARHPHARTCTVPNGVDGAYFDAHRGDPVPELAAAPRPVAGFLGTVAPWVDVELLARCAEAYPTWTFPIVGPVASDVDTSALRALPNVHFWGRVSYDRVPTIMAAFDVALMPFRSGDVSRAANPVTLYEFLYLGAPVVCTPMPELDALDHLLYMSRDGFVENLERAAAESDARIAKREAVGRAHDWGALVGDMLARLPLDF